MANVSESAVPADATFTRAPCLRAANPADTASGRSNTRAAADPGAAAAEDPGTEPDVEATPSVNDTSNVAKLRTAPGNLGAQMLSRDLGDGRTEVLTLSWWESLDSIRGFAGDDISVAVFYPEDDYLVDRETTVSHFDVASAG